MGFGSVSSQHSQTCLHSFDLHQLGDPSRIQKLRHGSGEDAALLLNHSGHRCDNARDRSHGRAHDAAERSNDLADSARGNGGHRSDHAADDTSDASHNASEGVHVDDTGNCIVFITKQGIEEPPNVAALDFLGFFVRLAPCRSSGSCSGKGKPSDGLQADHIGQREASGADARRRREKRKKEEDEGVLSL